MTPHRIYDQDGFEYIDKVDKEDLPEWPAAITLPINVVKTELATEDMPTPRTGSFSSIKEDNDGTAQSFLVRAVSSRNLPSQQTQIDDWSKCLPVHGITLSDADIIEEALSVASTPQNGPVPHDPFILDEVRGTGCVNLQDLPLEVLENVFDFLATDLPPRDYGPRNGDLVACLTTSKTLYKAAMNILYKNITIPHSYVYSKFLTHIKKYPELGRLVRRLDLSHFSAVGLGRTMQMNKSIQNMTATTLLECLELMPHLQELLLQEHLDHDIDENVLYKTFAGLPKLRALDLCGAYSNGFDRAFTSAITRVVDEDARIRINRLSLHDCHTIKGSDIKALVARLHNLEILDVYHTCISVPTLWSIPETARLTHLNLGHCTNLSGPDLVEFLCKHPAASELVYLNLSCDPARHRLLRVGDLDTLLPNLPSTLRSLNLAGAQIKADSHMVHLRRLSNHLEELGLAHTTLTMEDIKSFFPPPPPSPTSSPVPQPADAPVPQPRLHYLDLTDVQAVTQPALFFHRSGSSRIDADHPPPVPHFLSSTTLPLEVIEVNKRVASDLQKTKQANARFGWLPKELGRRSWYVRVQGSRERESDSAGGREFGGRWWKMGSRSWGMRKCPVVVGEVGGLYGHHMFEK